MKGTYFIVNPEKKPLAPGGSPAGGPPAGGSPAGGPPADGSPTGGPPAADPPAGGPPMGGGMPAEPMAKELKLVWDGETALWTNEMSQEVTLEEIQETENQLRFVAMAGPAPIEWTIKKKGQGYTAVSHRGADIHGNPPVDTVCQVKKL